MRNFSSTNENLIHKKNYKGLVQKSKAHLCFVFEFHIFIESHAKEDRRIQLSECSKKQTNKQANKQKNKIRMISLLKKRKYPLF